MDEVGTIIFDVQILPGFSRVVDSLTLFLVMTIGTCHRTASTSASGLMTLLALGFALVMSLLVNKIFPLGKVSLDLLF